LLSFDIRTLVFATHLASLGMGVVFLVVARGNRISGHAMVVWGLAFLARALGLLLIWCRASLPPLVSFVLANALVMTSFQLVLIGFLIFLDRPLRWRNQLLLAAVLAAAIAALHLCATYDLFVVGITLVLIGLELSAARLLFRFPLPGLAFFQTGLASLMLLEAAVMVCRLAWHLSGPQHFSLFAPSLLIASVYLELILNTVLFGTSLLGLVYQRAHLKKLELIAELEATLAKVHTLEGLLPMCAWCKKIRDESGNWHAVEEYVCDHTDAAITHGVCPDCRARFGVE